MTEEKPQQLRWKNMLLGCVSPLLGCLSSGYAQGHSAIFLAHVDLSLDDTSWIGSLLCVGLMVGAPIGGGLPLLTRWSRPTCLVMTSPLALGGWAAMMVGSKDCVTTFFVGRILLGLSAGCQIPLILRHLGAVASAAAPGSRKISGILTSLSPLVTCAGIVLSYICGLAAGSRWQWAAAVGAVLPLLQLVTSPLMYLRQSQQINSYQPENTTKEVEESTEKEESGTKLTNLVKTFASSIKKTMTAAVVRPAAVIVVLFTAQAFTGAGAVSYYASIIFSELADGAGGGANGSPSVIEGACIIVVGTTYVLGYFLSSTLLVGRFPRRILLAVSGGAMAVSTAAVAATGAAREVHALNPLAGALCASAALVLFVMAYSAGFGPVPFILLAETPGGDAVGGAVAAAAMTANFAALKSFPYLLAGLGLSSTFLLSSTVCSAGALFALAFVTDSTQESVTSLKEPPSSSTESIWV